MRDDLAYNRHLDEKWITEYGPSIVLDLHGVEVSFDHWQVVEISCIELHFEQIIFAGLVDRRVWVPQVWSLNSFLRASFFLNWLDVC